MTNTLKPYTLSQFDKNSASRYTSELKTAYIQSICPEVFADENEGVEPPAAAPAPAPQPLPDAPPPAPVVPLGFTRDKNSRMAVYSRSQGKVLILSPKDFNPIYLSTLGAVEEYAAWLGVEPPPTGDDTELYRQVAARLIREFHSMRGCFYDEEIAERSAGIWADDAEPGALVYFTGRTCYLVRPQQLPVPVDCVRGRHVYSASSPFILPEPAQTPLSDEDGSRLFQFIANRLWVKHPSTYAVVGWLGCSLLAGVLPVRPQLWVNAPAGVGKTFLKDDLTQILGPFAVTCESASSTAAGICQRLGRSSAPVLFDEAECRADQRSVRRLEGVLELVRSSATGNNSCVLKGSSDGTQRTYSARSCFMLFSIANILRREADVSRFLQVSLTIPQNGEKKVASTWAQQQDGRRLISEPDFTARLVTRMLMNYSTFEQNRRMLVPFLTEQGAAPRRAEMYAALFSACWSICHSETRITTSILNAFAKAFHTLERAQPTNNDRDTCLDVLLTHSLPWEGSRINVSSLCSLADTLPEGEQLEKVRRALASIGLRWKKAKRELQADVYSRAFKAIYRDTDWPTGQVCTVLLAHVEDDDLGIRKTMARHGAESNPRHVLCFPAEVVLFTAHDYVEN